jgi:hypothetical protein
MANKPPDPYVQPSKMTAANTFNAQPLQWPDAASTGSPHSAFDFFDQGWDGDRPDQAITDYSDGKPAMAPDREPTVTLEPGVEPPRGLQY